MPLAAIWMALAIVIESKDRENDTCYPEVPASTGDEALFQCTKPSGVPRGPSHLQFP